MALAAAQTGYLGGIEPDIAEQLERASAAEKRRAVEELVRKTSATAAMTTLQPLPVLDVAILTPLQHRMVRSTGRGYGRRLDDKIVRRMFRAVRRRIVATQA